MNKAIFKLTIFLLVIELGSGLVAASTPTQYTASGTYTYNSGAGILSLNTTSSDFICEGPDIGIENLTVISVSETTALLQEPDGYQMTWTRTAGTGDDITGTWNETEGPNSWQITLEANGNFSMIGLITECGEGEASEVYSIWTGISRTMTADSTTDDRVLHFHIWAPQGTVTQVQVSGPGMTSTTFTESFTEIRNGITVDNFSSDIITTSDSQIGDTYTFIVTRSDTTQETITQTIGQVILDAPQVTSPTGHALADANLGQTLSLLWTVPAGINSVDIYIGGGVCTATSDNYVTGTVSSATSGTIILPALAGATGAFLDIRVHHGDHVFMSTKYDFGSCGGAEDNIPPTAPTGLAATPISTNRIDLAWTPSTDNVGVEGYQVFRNGTQVATPVLPSFSDTGLVANTEYCYTVKASDRVNNISDPSNQACATTSMAGSVNTVSGTVMSVATGYAVGILNASVTVECDGETYTATTAQNGTWQIDDIPDGMYTVTISANYHQNFVLSDVHLSGGAFVVEIPGGSLEIEGEGPNPWDINASNTLDLADIIYGLQVLSDERTSPW